MEMLKDNTEKRTILLLLPDGDDARTFCANLEQDFIPVRSDTAEDCLCVMTERYADLSAVIVDADLDVRKDRENAIKAMESDAEIVRTGEGTSYVIQTGEGGSPTYIELTKMPVFDSEGNVTGIVAWVKNVTEQILIKNELEARLFTDELTGLGSRRAYDEYIESIAKGEVTFPLAVISVDCDRLKAMNDSYGHLVGDEYLRMSALIVKASLPEGARAFRMGGDEFLAFVPGVSQEEADHLIAEMREHQERLKLEEASISISLGAAVLESADDDLVAAIERADRVMYADKVSRKQLR